MIMAIAFSFAMPSTAVHAQAATPVQIGPVLVANFENPWPATLPTDYTAAKAVSVDGCEVTAGKFEDGKWFDMTLTGAYDAVKTACKTGKATFVDNAPEGTTFVNAPAAAPETVTLDKNVVLKFLDMMMKALQGLIDYVNGGPAPEAPAAPEAAPAAVEPVIQPEAAPVAETVGTMLNSPVDTNATWLFVKVGETFSINAKEVGHVWGWDPAKKTLSTGSYTADTSMDPDHDGIVIMTVFGRTVDTALYGDCPQISGVTYSKGPNTGEVIVTTLTSTWIVPDNFQAHVHGGNKLAQRTIVPANSTATIFCTAGTILP